MIALLQRVSDSHVEIEGKTVGQIGKGLTVFLCVEQKDGEREADALLKRLLTYRVFHDDAGKMNLSVKDVGGGLLLIPQFTLAADTNSGTRPSFSPAAAPDEGKRLFEYFAKQAKNAYETVETGIFGADMKVTIVNDGPVTFWLQVKPK